MSTLVVKTALFPVEPEGDLELCNGQPGSAFAEWLKVRLASQEFACDAVIQEDYGWGFWIKSKETTFWVCVSFAPEESKETPDPLDGEWFVTVEHEIPMLFLRPWLWHLKKTGKDESNRIFGIIRQVISDESAMEILRED